MFKTRDQQLSKHPHLSGGMPTRHAAELTEVLVQHVGGSGIAFLWEQQLLNTPVPKTAG